MSAKPIMMAGKGKPFFKGKKLATNPCPEIYVFSLNHAYGYNDGPHVVHCLSHKDLKHLFTQDAPSPFQQPVTGALLDMQQISEVKIFNGKILWGGFSYNADAGDNRPTLNIFDIGLNQKQIIPRDPSGGGQWWGMFYDMCSTVDGHIFALSYGGIYKVDPGVWVYNSKMYCYPQDLPAQWNAATA